MVKANSYHYYLQDLETIKDSKVGRGGISQYLKKGGHYETKNCYYYPEYTDGYAVNDFGGFGIYPNQRDLVEVVS